MRFSTELWKQLKDDVTWRLEVVRPLRYSQLNTVPTKRGRVAARQWLGGSDVYLSASIDTDQLNEIQENAVILGAALLRDIELKADGPEFLFSLAEFYYACGFIVSASSIWKFDEGKKRAGEQGGKKRKSQADAMKAWAAREISSRVDAGLPRHRAEEDVAKTILNTLRMRKRPKGLTQKWLNSFLASDKRSLRDAYSSKRMPDAEMEAFALAKIKKPILPTS